MTEKKLLTGSLLAIVALLFGPTEASVINEGTISGTVVSQGEKPVSGVEIWALLDGNIHVSFIPWAYTDSNGAFSFTGMMFGSYILYEEKKADFYPRLPPCFYSPSTPYTATLTSEKPSAEVRIKLPPPGGRITGTISNARKGPLQPNVSISLRTNKHCEVAMSVNSDFDVLVPSGMDVDFVVRANGFKDWSYESVSRGAPLNLTPREVLKIKLKLKPISRK